MNAKHFLSIFSTVFLAAFSILSCNKSESDNHELPVSGLPSIFTYNNGSEDTYSYTNGNRLSKITYGKSGTTQLSYDGSNLVKCSFSYSPEVSGMDYIEFSKLDDSSILAKIHFPEYGIVTSPDTIQIRPNGYPNVIRCGKNAAAEFYTEYRFSLDETGTRIAEMLSTNVYNTYSVLGGKHVYEYDTNPGITSLIDCPKWFSTYFCIRFDRGMTDRQLLNCVDNITKETVYNDFDPNPIAIFSNDYTYGNNKFPVSMIDGRTQEKISIKYP